MPFPLERGNLRGIRCVVMKHEIIKIITKNSPHLGWIDSGLIYLVRHGSMAYNCHMEGSDEDIKGITIPNKSVLYGLNNFEQTELKAPDPDTVIYNLKKFINLATKANPNILEMLYVDPSDHLFISPLGKVLLDNRAQFLTKRIRFTAGGFAYDQVRRLKLHRGYLLNPIKDPPTRKEFNLPECTLIPRDQFEAAKSSIKKELDKFNFAHLELEEADRVSIRNMVFDMLTEAKLTEDHKWLAAANKVGLDDNFIYLMQQERAYENKKQEWDRYQQWKKNRNPKRAEAEAKYGYDCKFAYHTIRCLREARDALKLGELIVKRPDREELLEIRRGEWSYEKLIETAEREDKELDALYETSKLPKAPDSKFLDKLSIDLIERKINGGED